VFRLKLESNREWSDDERETPGSGSGPEMGCGQKHLHSERAQHVRKLASNVTEAMELAGLDQDEQDSLGRD
jgi:hypothetical protein